MRPAWGGFSRGTAILFYNLVDGFLHVNASKEVLRDLLSLFPEVDPDAIHGGERLRRLLADRDPNGLHRLFKVVP